MNDFKIGFVCPSPSWGGLEMNVLRLAGWLTERGRHIVIYAYPDSLLYQRARDKGFDVRGLRSTSKGRDILLSFRLARLVRADNARIVVLHRNQNFILTVLARIWSRRFFKLVYVQHMHVGGTKRDFFHTWIYSHLAAWVAPLPWFGPVLTAKTRMPQAKIRIIPHGIELNRFTDAKPSKTTARRQLGLPEDVFLAGEIGRLDPKKGQHILIEACARLHRDGHRIHLLILGDESVNEKTGYADRLRQLTAHHHLREYVHFRPHLPEVEYAYAALDLFVLTSKSETYGMVTIEAMASELPVIGTAEGGTPDIINDGGNGLLVKPFDVDELYQALLKLVTDRLLAQRLAGEAKKDALAKYSHERQCTLLDNLFRELTESSAAVTSHSS